MAFDFKSKSNNQKSGKFDFSSQEGKQNEKAKREDENSDKEYRSRAKKEKSRFDIATDGLFWFCLCFCTEGDLKRFSSRFGIDGRYVPGDDFAKSMQPVKPNEKKHGFGSKTSGSMAKDPLAKIEYSGNLEKDCISEAMAIYDALVSAKPEHPVKHASDSDIWICVYFRTQEEKLDFLDEYCLSKYGTNYLDGSKMLREI